MKHFYIQAALPLLIFTSCLHHPKDGEIPILVSENNIETVDDAQLSDLLEEISFIPLQETPKSILGIVHKLQRTDDGYYVMATGSNFRAEVYRFDHQGQFLNKIGSIGNADNEYLRIGSFMVQDDRVYVADLDRRRIVAYDKEGQLLNFHESNRNIAFLHDMEPIGNGKALLSYCINFDSNDALFEIVDLNTFAVLHTVSTPYKSQGSLPYAIKEIGYDGEQILLALPFDNTLYAMDAQEFALRREISIDLWGHPSLPDSKDMEEILKATESGRGKWLYGIFISGNKILINSMAGSVIWNKSTGTGLYVKNGYDLQKAKCFPFLPLSVLSSDQEGFYATLSADSFNAIAEELHSRDSGPTPQEGGNPVIVRYSLKD